MGSAGKVGCVELVDWRDAQAQEGVVAVQCIS
jgi:hypothetical protein